MTLLSLAHSAVRGSERISPALAASLALRLFFTLGPRMKVTAREEATMARAARGTLVVRGRRIATYAWGDAAQPVLLVHGWRGRAAQFSDLADRLVRDGYRVLAFDAPAHGASPGRRTDIRDWVAAIGQLHDRHGRFRAIVGHSFGSLAALTAVRNGVAAEAVVTIAGAGSPDVFADEFSRTLRLTPAVRARFDERFHRRLGETAASFRERYDALAFPVVDGPPLLALHDVDDRALPVRASEDLVAAHAPRAELIRTSGLGHRRILSAPETLDAVSRLVAPRELTEPVGSERVSRPEV